MSDFILRPATQRDKPAIQDLIHRARINPFGLNWRRFVVAVNASDMVLGCGQLKYHGARIAELASIAVEPRDRRRGIANAMIEHLIAKAPRPLYLTCRTPLGQFYSRWGFRELRPQEMPAYYGRLSRLARLFAKALHEEGMLVMVLQ